MIDEGYTKYVCDWRESPPLPDENIAGLNTWRNRLYDLGLIGFYKEDGVGFGNISVREGNTASFIISGTRTGHIERTDAKHYARVTGCDIDTNRVSCEGPVQASSEALTHAAIYSLDSNIGAVVHAHSRRIWESLVGRLPTTASGVSYGTPEMAEEFVRLYEETGFRIDGVAIMAGHEEGVVSFGSGVDQAAKRLLHHLS